MWDLMSFPLRSIDKQALGYITHEASTLSRVRFSVRQFAYPLLLSLNKRAFVDFRNAARHCPFLPAHASYTESIACCTSAVNNHIYSRHDRREERRDYLLSFQQEKDYIYNIIYIVFTEPTGIDPSVAPFISPP